MTFLSLLCVLSMASFDLSAILPVPALHQRLNDWRVVFFTFLYTVGRHSSCRLVSWRKRERKRYREDGSQLVRQWLAITACWLVPMFWSHARQGTWEQREIFTLLLLPPYCLPVFSVLHQNWEKLYTNLQKWSTHQKLNTG